MLLLSLLIILLLSNPVIFNRDKFMLFSRIIIQALLSVNFIGCYNLIIASTSGGLINCGFLFNVTLYTKVLFVVSFLALIVFIVIVAVVLFGLNQTLFVLTGLASVICLCACMRNFHTTNYQGIILILSIITLILLVRNGLDKSSFSNTILFLRLPGIPSLLIITLIVVCLFRNTINDIFIVSYMSYGNYAMFIFSFTIPRVILSRIVINSGINLISSNSCNHYHLLCLILAQLFNYENYKLSNIRISRLTLVLYIMLPMVDVFIFLGNILYALHLHEVSGGVKPAITHLYTSWSPLENTDNIVFPTNRPFVQELNLNRDLSKTEDQLKSLGAVGESKPTGMGDEQGFIYRLNNKTWVRSNNGLFYKESYMKGRFTNALTQGMFNDHPYINFNYDILYEKNYHNNEGVADAINDIRSDDADESQVDHLVFTLFPHYFSSWDAFKLCGQGRLESPDGSIGKVDAMVTNKGNPVIMVEDKAHASTADSFLALLEQARTYCRSSPSHEVVFLMATKGTKVSFFMYDQDWHSIRKMDLKSSSWQDLIGLQVTSSGISLVTQYNTFHPQLKVYDFKNQAPNHDTLAITSIFSFISQFKTGKSIEDIQINEGFVKHEGFALPENTNKTYVNIAKSNRGAFTVGFNHTLQIDPFGKFRHIR